MRRVRISDKDGYLRVLFIPPEVPTVSVDMNLSTYLLYVDGVGGTSRCYSFLGFLGV